MNIPEETSIIYTDKNLCLEHNQKRKNTNSRYKWFKQTIFHAGDTEQFMSYRNYDNGNLCEDKIELKNNMYQNFSIIKQVDIYKNLKSGSVTNTFNYIFNKFKKGIYVKILNNKLNTFLPFSKVGFINEWGDKIKVDRQFLNIEDFLRRLNTMEGRKFNSRKVTMDTYQWYANNCLLRYEFPISEHDSNVGTFKNMLDELCTNRKIPDIEFFINRRDFPILTKNRTEPYNNIWGKNHKLVSHSYNKYSPIFSMSSAERYADMTFPLWEDWCRVQSYEGKFFPDNCRDYTEDFKTTWKNKKPTAVFRGASTGCGVTIKTNNRLKACYLSAITKPDENGIPYLDCGITKWNLRPRKIEGEEYLKTINISKLPFSLANRLSAQEQSQYKYILNIDGHVTAFRLSFELSFGSVILLVKSDWKIWYSDMLKPYVHYVPVKEDLSDLIEVVKWCRKNDDKCMKIAENAFEFFNKYLSKQGIFDYLQKLLVDTKKQTGKYLYNTLTPLQAMINYEYKNLDTSYPPVKTLETLDIIPSHSKSYGLYRGIEWVIRKIIRENDFETLAQFEGDIFKNKLGLVSKYKLANFSFVVKKTEDKQKKREHIHETFISTKAINNLSSYIPNFSYIFGLYEKNNNVNVVSEYISGISLQEYLSSKQFNFKTYLFIFAQICLSIQVAQNKIGFVHYDLTPWNIIIHKLPKIQRIDYEVNNDTVVRVRTDLIPVIIDYGKSHVVYNEIHHGFINMFNYSTIQDILTFLLTSMNTIFTNQYLDKNNLSQAFNILNKLSNTKYRREPFTNLKSVKEFISKNKKYSELIEKDKYDLEKYTPFDFFKSIMSIETFKEIMFVSGINSKIYKGNPLQVYNFILSNTIKDKIESYTSIFYNILVNKIPFPDNLFNLYYSAQQITENLSDLDYDFKIFLDKNNIKNKKYEKVSQNTYDFIDNLYKEKINSKIPKKITYDIQENSKFKNEYDCNTFANPNIILKLLNIYKNISTCDLTNYKRISIDTLFNKSIFEMKASEYNFYYDNLKSLLESNSFEMINRTADIKTLFFLSKIIFQDNLKYLKDDCEEIKKYKKIYKEIFFLSNK